MQIYALDDTGKIIHAHQGTRKLSYRCPECRQAVRLRSGPLRQLHFYHSQKGSCHLGGKSLTHLQIQLALQKMLGPQESQLEKSFPQIGRIADVIWPSKKLVFEIQVSAISCEEVAARNRDYAQLGLQVVWILHDRQFNRFNLSSAEAALRSFPHYFTNINAVGKGIFYDQYSYIRFRRRIARTPRFAVYFKQINLRQPKSNSSGYLGLLQEKQLPRQLPLSRRKWPLSFGGDLNSRHAFWAQRHKKSFSFKNWTFFPFRLILQLLLEKTTS